MTRTALVCVAIASLAVTGCLKALGPDVGPLTAACVGAACPDAAVCSDADSNPAMMISFKTDILGGVLARAGCVNCHTGDGLGINQSGFNMASYTTLRAGGHNSGASVVIDGQPCTSIIVEKVKAPPPFGRRMPYNGPPYLSATDIQLISDWIAEGALDN
jgi:hypothetical protein